MIETAENALLIDALRRYPVFNVLDIGCGNPNRMRAVFRIAGLPAPIVSGDTRPYNETVRLMDVRELPKEHFRAIVCCRVLCNLQGTEERARAIDSLFDALLPNGLLFLVDGIEDIRRQVNDARAAVGWRELPPSSSGSSGLERAELHALDRRADLIQCKKVAPDYTVWTRVVQRDLFPPGSVLQQCYPQFSPQAHRLCWNEFRLYRRRT